MDIFLFATIGVGLCTAVFIAWGFYRKWRLANRHISVYLVASLFILNMVVNMTLTRANILAEQGDFFLRDIRRGILVLVFVLVYLFLRSTLINYFDTTDRIQKSWLTHGALILFLFYIWNIAMSLVFGLLEQQEISPSSTLYFLSIVGPFLLIIILYLLGRQLLPQK